MPKPKAPRWLTQAFADGVDERERAFGGRVRYHCWLAQHDERRRPCLGRLERAHLIPRRRVENALWAVLYGAVVDLGQIGEEMSAVKVLEEAEFWDLILLAAWDPRNGVVACEAHHRRFDNHSTPALVIPAPELPDHMLDFIFDWGLDTQAEDRFPNFIRY